MARRMTPRTAGRPAARRTDPPARASVRDFAGGARFAVGRDVRPVAACLPESKRDHQLPLLRDPEQTHREVVAVLRAWLKPFSEIEARVVAMIERDYSARAADRATLVGPDLIESTTGGVRWLGEPGV